MSCKPWQKGYSLAYLEALQDRFDSYNQYAQHALTKFKKNNIAVALSQDELQILGEDSIIHRSIVKRKTKIYMFLRSVVIGEKVVGDIHIKHLGYTTTKQIINTLNTDVLYTQSNVWLYIHEESSLDREIVAASEFEKVGVKYNSLGDVFGVYFRNAKQHTQRRTHPKHLEYEHYAIQQLNLDFSEITSDIATKLEGIEFENHYSNYNYKNSWSALSLRGYTDDPHFIMKPTETNKKWRDQNRGMEFKLQNTDLLKTFPMVEEKILKHFDAVDRVRFMKLNPHGELLRHTDQIDPDAGISNGKIMRIHIPIVTNPGVEFTTWSPIENNVVMNAGECWYLDRRKPHRVINNGDTSRIHLVIDAISNERVRNFLK